MNTYLSKSNTCYMSISMLHAHVYAAVHVHAYVHVQAACLCQCCMFKSMQKGQGHAARTWTCSMELDMYNSMDTYMKHGDGHACPMMYSN